MPTKAVVITPEMHEVLGRATIEGQVVKLPPGQLAPQLYKAIDKALKALGGKWSRRHGGHLFTRTVELEQALRDGQVIDRKRTMEQFWTPHPVVMRMCELAGDFEGEDVLEPSAGHGGILFEIIGRGAFPCGVEYDAELAMHLMAETEGQVPIFAEDFLLWSPRPPYSAAAFDLVLMNPPFSNGQDMRHVLHAFQFLKPEGRLVAVMSTHWRFASDTISRQFREWADSIGGVWEELPSGSFKPSETGVATGLLKIVKGEG